MCGHPSVPSLKKDVLYFVVTDTCGKISISADFRGEDIGKIHVLVSAQAVDFILEKLKEVFK